MTSFEEENSSVSVHHNQAARDHMPSEHSRRDQTVSAHQSSWSNSGKSMPESEGVVLENVSIGLKSEDSKKHVAKKPVKRRWTLGLNDIGMDLVRACAAEALGTFFLILICVGSANSRVLDQLSNTTGTLHLQPLYYIGISFAFGIGIGGIVHILADASGGHVNPAVSFALFLDKRISFVGMVFYMIAQFAGGFAGAGVLYGLGNHGDDALKNISGGNSYDPEFLNWGQAFFFEVFGTMFLVLTILSSINESRGHAPSYLQPLAIGLSIFVVHIWLIPYTNCAINPVRGVVWNIIIGQAGSQSFIFLFGPLVGGGLAVPIFNFIFNP